MIYTDIAIISIIFAAIVDLFIIKNKVGTFVAMNEFTFNELISLYEYTIKNINNDK